MTPTELFESAINTLREEYSTHRFFMERDVVWTVQLQIIGDIERLGLPYRVFNDYDIGVGRQYPDLVIVDNEDKVEVAAEFKYEPSHDRDARFGGDIPKSKINPSRVFWDDRNSGSVVKDVQRVRDYVSSGRAKVAYSIFIDEGGYFTWRGAPPGSEWVQWDNGVSVLSRTVQ